MNWKKLFKKRILDRGYDYYLENAVENLEIVENIISADIIGTDYYEVDIYLNHNEIADMRCTCPYAESGNNCKHMAAVLYKWSEYYNESDNDEVDNNIDLFKQIETLDEYNTKFDTIKNMVANADDKKVRSFLATVLMDNENLLQRFITATTKKPTTEDIYNYLNLIDNIAEEYSDKYDYIDYYHADDFISELEEIIDNDIQLMIENHNIYFAFSIISYIFKTIGEVPIDDSNGCTGYLGDKIYHIWLILLSKADSNEKKRMFEWFTAHLDGSITDYLQDYIEYAIMEDFKEEEYKQLKLKLIDKMIRKSNKNSSEYTKSYNEGKWACRYIDILNEQSASRARIKNAYKKYWHNSDIRKHYIDLCLYNNDYDNALVALDESISLDKENPGLIIKYNTIKKDIYKIQSNKDAYIKQLWKLLVIDNNNYMVIYKELKKQYNAEEWNFKVEELIKNPPSFLKLDKIYKEEKMYNKLIEVVLNSSGLTLLLEYDDILKDDYPEQLLSKYKNELDFMSVNAGSRKHYSHLVHLLRRVRKIKGGTELVDQIVNNWKVIYKNRPAMMDELSKL